MGLGCGICRHGLRFVWGEILRCWILGLGLEVCSMAGKSGEQEKTGELRSSRYGLGFRVSGFGFRGVLYTPCTLNADALAIF